MPDNYSALLTLTMITTPTANRLETESRDFDHLVGTQYPTLAALVQAVANDLNTRSHVWATYDLVGRLYSVQIHADRSSSGPLEV